MSRRPTNRTARRPLSPSRLEDRTAPAVAIWDAGGANNKWTTPANWVGDVAPQPGDDLVFPAGVRPRTNVNDFPAGTVFHSIAVNGAAPTQNETGYQISGNAVAVTAGVTADFAFGSYPLDSTSTLSLDVSGTGGVTKNGTGRFVLAGNNSYTGVTTVNAGVLEVRTDTGLGAIGAGNETNVISGATLDLNNLNQLVAGLPSLTIAEPISFAGDGVFETSSILGAISGDYRPLLTGPLTLTGNGRIAGFLTITSGVGETGGPRDLYLSGPTIASTAVNTNSGTTTVSTVQYDGRGPGPVVVAGDLVGTGTINGPVRGSVGGTVRGGTGIFSSPPPVPGTLTVGDLDLSQGTMRVVIGADGASEIAVRGTVRLGGNLDVSLLAGQASNPTPLRLRVGDRFRIIDNDGTDPVAGTFAGLPEGGLVKNIRPFPLRISYHGGDGNDVVVEAVSAPATAVGAGTGGLPTVNVYDADGTLMRSFLVYDASFRGGVRVTLGDITDDGILDLITAAGPGGGPHVKIFDGATGALFRQFLAYDPAFRGGVFVATAPIKTFDRVPDIITGAGPGGGPHVKVFNGETGAVMSSFMAYDPAFRGGVSVAGISMHVTSGFEYVTPHDGLVVTGAGPGGGPHVRVFNGLTGAMQSEFFAYDPAFRGGVNVAATLDYPAIVTGPGVGGGPDVKVFNQFGGFLGRFFAYAADFRGGVTVAVTAGGTVAGSAITLLTGPGPGGGPHVRRWRFPNDFSAIDPSAFVLQGEFLAFDPTFTGGIFVGSGELRGFYGDLVT